MVAGVRSTGVPLSVIVARNAGAVSCCFRRIPMVT
jgi:hypothetical protein